MFCPKCSQLQASDNLHFCSRCGFRLDEVKALIEHEEALAAADESRSEGLLPRQKDISIGAGLMFIGGVVAVLWGFILGAGPFDVVLPQAFFILGFTLALVLLFFNPLVRTLHKLFSGVEEKSRNLSKQQNGINLGAILMFIGTLKAMLIATFMHPGRRGAATLLMMTGGLLLLLIIRWLVQTVYKLLFKGTTDSREVASTKDTSELTARLPSSPHVEALPPARSIPVNEIDASKARNAEMAQPPSVTEYSTELLDKE